MKEILTDLLIAAFFLAISAGVGHRLGAQDSCKGQDHGAHAAQPRR